MYCLDSILTLPLIIINYSTQIIICLELLLYLREKIMLSRMNWEQSSEVSFKYDQQDATLYNILYYCQCSTCFGRFPRPSSGAQELYAQHLVCRPKLVDH